MFAAIEEFETRDRGNRFTTTVATDKRPNFTKRKRISVR